MSDIFSSRNMSQLSHIGIEEPWELLLNLPLNYDNFTNPLKSINALRALGNGKSCYAMLKLVNIETSEDISKKNNKDSKGRAYVKVTLSDGLQTISSFVFGSPREWLELKKKSLNTIVHVSGKLSVKDYINLNNLQIVPESDQNRVVARYRGREKKITPLKVADFTQISLIHYADQAVSHICDKLDEDEASIIRNCRLPFYSLKQFITALHLPKNPAELESALLSARRLNAYDGIRKAITATARQPVPKSAIPLDIDLIKKLVEQHPYTPTKDQRRAIWEIIQDLSSSTPMDRLLSADVGNGKTLAYGIPAAYACHKGKNTVVLLPTEPLAGQVADNIRSWFPELRVHLATSGFAGDVRQGDMIIGTTAVLSWLKKNIHWKVDFAITDEQQKMGTAQREAMYSLGTHILEATATPIPRTMAQTLFGTKKVSLIDDCPVEKDIKTHLLGNGPEEKRFAMKTLDQWVKDGRKIIIIYPLVAERQAYYYHAKVDAAEEAEKIGNLMRRPGITLKNVLAVEDAIDVMAELGNSAEDGFIIELHGEEFSHSRLEKRLDRAVGAHAEDLRYLGSRVDDDLNQRNKSTIIQGAEKWEKKYPGQVAIIHGRSKAGEKTEILKIMNKGEKKILLATTLVEIGVDIRDTNALMVLDAEKLGAFPLHQLRGRIARNGGKGDFFMLAGCSLENLEQTARERLELLVKFKRGKDIALHDMEQRGFGNLSAGGQAQKGFDDGLFPSLKLSASELDNFLKDLARDLGMMQESSARSPSIG